MPIVSSMTPCGPDPARERDSIEFRQSVGKQNEDQPHAGRERRETLQRAFRVVPRKQTELDVIDAVRGRSEHRGTDARLLKRQVADGRAHRNTATDRSDASLDGRGWKSAERPCVRVLEVDDVGPGADRELRLGGVAHACQEKSAAGVKRTVELRHQRNSQLNMPPPPPPPPPPLPRRAARRPSGGAPPGCSKLQKSSRATGALRALRS